MKKLLLILLLLLVSDNIVESKYFSELKCVKDTSYTCTDFILTDKPACKDWTITFHESGELSYYIGTNRDVLYYHIRGLQCRWQEENGKFCFYVNDNWYEILFIGTRDNKKNIISGVVFIIDKGEEPVFVGQYYKYVTFRG